MESKSLKFNNVDDFINHWSNHLKLNEPFESNFDPFAKEFISAFPTKQDYLNYLQVNGGEEYYQLFHTFNIVVGDREDCNVSEKDWSEFYNSCWTWV